MVTTETYLPAHASIQAKGTPVIFPLPIMSPLPRRENMARRGGSVRALRLRKGLIRPGGPHACRIPARVDTLDGMILMACEACSRNSGRPRECRQLTCGPSPEATMCGARPLTSVRVPPDLLGASPGRTLSGRFLTGPNYRQSSQAFVRHAAAPASSARAFRKAACGNTAKTPLRRKRRRTPEIFMGSDVPKASSRRDILAY